MGVHRQFSTENLSTKRLKTRSVEESTDELNVINPNHDGVLLFDYLGFTSPPVELSTLDSSDERYVNLTSCLASMGLVSCSAR